MADMNYISPYIRVAIDSIIDPPWIVEERVIFDYELLYIMEGEVFITIEGQSYDGKPGDVFLFKPKQRHSIRLTGNSRVRQPHIHFDLFYLPDSPEVRVSFKPLEKMSEYELTLFREDITGHPDTALPNRIYVRNIGYFEDMLFEIIKEYSAKLPYYEINVRGLFLKLWTFILRENNFSLNPVAFSNIEELDRIRDYLNCNTDREVSLNELSRHFKMSKYHLARQFKKAFGMTPIHFNHLVRVEKAREMVQYSGRSLTEISEIFGFNSINAFSRAFRNIEGVPPSFYR